MEIHMGEVFWVLHNGKKFNNLAFFCDKFLTDISRDWSIESAFALHAPVLFIERKKRSS